MQINLHVLLQQKHSIINCNLRNPKPLASQILLFVHLSLYILTFYKFDHLIISQNLRTFTSMLVE